MGLNTSQQSLIEQRVRNDGPNMVLAYVLLIFLGMLGIHRFYLGRIGSGIAQLILTLTIIGSFVTAIWVFIDLFLVPGMVNNKRDEIRQKHTVRMLSVGSGSNEDGFGRVHLSVTNNLERPTAPEATAKPNPTRSTDELIIALERLQKLKEAGVLDEAEFGQRKAKLLDEHDNEPRSRSVNLSSTQAESSHDSLLFTDSPHVQSTAKPLFESVSPSTASQSRARQEPNGFPVLGLLVVGLLAAGGLAYFFLGRGGDNQSATEGPQAGVSLSSWSGDDPTLCESGENVIWSCKRNKRTYSFCASSEVSSESGYIQYRAGSPGSLELVFPKNKVPPEGLFEYQMGPQGNESIEFKVGEYRYYYLKPLRDSNTEVLVEKSSETISSFSCNGGDSFNIVKPDLLGISGQTKPSPSSKPAQRPTPEKTSVAPQSAKPSVVSPNISNERDRCLALMTQGVQYKLLEDPVVCGFYRGAGDKLKTLYDRSGCMTFVYKNEIEEIAADILERARDKIQELGREQYCESQNLDYVVGANSIDEFVK